jgi:hypothetical protein
MPSISEPFISDRYSSWKFLIDFLEFPFLSAYVSMILQQNMLLLGKWTERLPQSLPRSHSQCYIIRWTFSGNGGLTIEAFTFISITTRNAAGPLSLCFKIQHLLERTF